MQLSSSLCKCWSSSQRWCEEFVAHHYFMHNSRMSNRKYVVRDESNTFEPLHHKDFGKFWQEKTLRCNGFNLFLPETKEDPKKPPKTLFFFVFCCFLLFFPIFSVPHIFSCSILMHVDHSCRTALKGPFKGGIF